MFAEFPWWNVLYSLIDTLPVRNTLPGIHDLVEERERLDADVEADQVHELVHSFQLLVKFSWIQFCIGESSVDTCSQDEQNVNLMQNEKGFD